MYTPDNWVVLKIKRKEELTYKVLVGWSGGYLDGDSWRLNSGIVKIDKNGDYYNFHGYSGSVYKCHKNSETLRMNNMHIYEQLKKKYGDNIDIVPIEEVRI